MTYSRVNLLKKSEQRYQGTVSRRFILISVVVTPILLIAVFSAIKMVQYTGVQADLKAKRSIWENIEPQLALFNEKNQSLTVNRKVLDLFEGWEQSQLPMEEILNGIQQTVPGNIQLTRLSIRGAINGSVYETPQDMELDYTMQVEGQAQGERAETDVWQFLTDLNDSATISSGFETIRLAGSMRQIQRSNGETARTFRIQGSAEEETP